MTPMKTDDTHQQSYASQVLMEEITTLRKRVKLFEDEQETATERSGKTVDTDFDSIDQQEVQNLRKELKKVENEKAALELSFMNQISEIARDSADKVDVIQKTLDQTKAKLNATRQSRETDVGGGSNTEIEFMQLREDLASADREVEVNRRDVDKLYKKANKLESQKAALSDEVAGLRLEVDNEKKVIISLNMVMEENDKHFKSRIDKHESERTQQRSYLNEEKEKQTILNNKISKYESQKGMLLEEVTDIRMQLDREEQSKNAFKKKFEELEQNMNGERDSSAIGSLKQAARDAEDKTDELQSELRAVAKSYKNDVYRLEENVSVKESEVEEIRKQINYKNEELAKQQKEKTKIEQDNRDIREELEKEKGMNLELQTEVLNLNSMHSAFENKSSKTIVEHVAQLNKLKGKVAAIEEANIQLKHDLSMSEKAVASRIVSTAQSKNGAKYLETTELARSQSSTTESRGQHDEFEHICTKIEKLKRRVKELEEQLSDANDKNVTLKQRLKIRSEQAAELQTQVATMSATETAAEESLRGEYDEEREQQKSHIEKVVNELVLARKAIHTSTEETKKLKSEIREMTIERLAYEECTMQAYEKRATASQKDCQIEVNGLKVALTNLQMKYASMEKEFKSEIEGLEEEMENLNIECDTELEEKQGELGMVTHKLNDKLDMVKKLEKEREQLCLQMNNMSGNRRDELEEIQSDLMEMTAKNTSLNRALQALQMQVEHQADNTTELESLRAQMEKFQGRNSAGISIHKQQTQLEALYDENQKLQDKLRKITYERRSLQDQLKTALSGSATRTMQVLKERNEKLRRDVERLTRKLQNGGGVVTRIAI